MERAFLIFEETMVFSQAFQDHRNVVVMFGHTGVDEDISNVD